MGAPKEANGISEAAVTGEAQAGSEEEQSSDFVSGSDPGRRLYSCVAPSRPSLVVPHRIEEMHAALAAVKEDTTPVASGQASGDSKSDSLDLDLHDLRVLRHEVANPLTYLLNAAMLMRREIDSHHCPRNQQLQEMIDIIDQAARQILGIIDSAQKQPSEVPPTNPSENPTFKKTDLSHVLRTLAASWKVLTDAEGIHFESRIDNDVHVLAHNTKLFEVLSNLMTNAIEVLREVDSPAITVTLRVHPTIPGLVQVFFHDNGPGIPESHKNQIFSKGFSGKGGHGIGLWRSRRLVREMGGELVLVNNRHPNKRDDFDGLEDLPGATAVVELPLCTDLAVEKTDSE